MSSAHWAGQDFLALAESGGDRVSTAANEGQTTLLVIAGLSCAVGILLGVGLLWFVRRASAREMRGRSSTEEVEQQVGTISELGPLPNVSQNRKGHNRVKSSKEDLENASEASEVESFYSCHGEELEQALAPRKETKLTMSYESLEGLLADPNRPRRPRQNANLVTQYRWLQDLLENIVNGAAGSLTGCKNGETGQSCIPLFVVAGVCPSKFPPSPMQAVLFSQSGGKLIDFWFVKPEAGNSAVLEQATLSKNAKGPHKNNAERSKNLYNPLAEKFAGRADGDCVYGVDAKGRAFIEERTALGQQRRMLVYFVWIENWSSGMTGKKFLEGKICFEKERRPGTGRGEKAFCARQYRIEDGSILLAPREEEESLPGMMPPEEFQRMC